DGQSQLEGARLRRLEAEAVTIILAGDVAGEGIQAVGPPEACSFVLIEGERLPGQRLSQEGLHGQIAIQDVINLRAILQVVPVPDALVADAVAHHQVVRAVDSKPAVATVPDGCADDRATAHGVADKVVVQTVTAKHALLAEVAKFGVANRAG